MRRMIEIATQTGLLTDFPATVPEDQAKGIPADNLFYLVTGSQGEGRAALARIAAGTHPTVTLNEGDTVLFSSKTSPATRPASTASTTASARPACASSTATWSASTSRAMPAAATSNASTGR